MTPRYDHPGQSKPIHLYTEPCSITTMTSLKYSNRTVIYPVQITKCLDNQWLDIQESTVALLVLKCRHTTGGIVTQLDHSVSDTFRITSMNLFKL